MWPLTLYEVPLLKVDKLEKMINSIVRKWLGVPRCLSTVVLYGKEFKCAKSRLGLALKDKDIMGHVENVA